MAKTNNTTVSLGNGVYATFQGYSILLTTTTCPDGIDMPPEAVEKLLDFRNVVNDAVKGE